MTSDLTLLSDAPDLLNYLNEQESEELNSLLEEEEQELARQFLIPFAQYVDPAAEQWYNAQHLRRIAALLEQVARGELKRLIITVPPRHWKSSLASEKFPAWYLAHHKTHSVIVASYAVSLAEKYSKSVRAIVAENSRFRELFPDVHIKKDSNRTDDWLLDAGYRTSFRAVGTGGGIAGHGAQLILLDDVSDPNKQPSQVGTESDWVWYKNVIRTRLEPDGAILVINNRVGVNDLVGYLLDPERNDSADPPEDWTVINIPAMSADGSYLWADRFGEEYYQKLQNDPTLWRVQYQQQPVTAEGTDIKRDSFEYVEQLPEGTRETAHAWDLAITLKETSKHDPDYTAGLGGTFHRGILYLVSPTLKRQEVPDTLTDMMAYKYNSPWVRLALAKSNVETTVGQFLKRQGHYVQRYPERKDIRQRAAAFINLVATGRVKLVGTPSQWAAFMDQWTAFPNGAHDDAVAVAAGLTYALGVIQPIESDVDESERVLAMDVALRGQIREY